MYNLQKKGAASRQPSFRDKISDTINDTLRKKKKVKSKPEIVDLDFLYINRPDFSSAESLNGDNNNELKNSNNTEIFVSG